MKTRFLLLLICLSLLCACSGLPGAEPAVLLPTEKLPTIIAMTLEAQGVALAEQSPAPTQDITRDNPTPAASASLSPTRTSGTRPAPTPTSRPTRTITPRPSLTPRQPTDTPDIATLMTRDPSEATHTPAPQIPEARIQIYWIGERSKVVSPLQVIARLTSQVGKVVRVELYGEDGRLLARQVKTYQRLPWHVAGLNMSLPFEISLTAEAGRLVVSAEDVFGRLIDLNSVNLILLSTGETELNPTSALWQRIVIQEPAPMALIQGGKLLVSGLAQPEGDQPLQVLLVAEDGRVVGQRLAGVNPATPGGYGTFFAEVPYSVEELTPARLTVSEDGGLISPLAHLASIEVQLSP